MTIEDPRLNLETEREYRSVPFVDMDVATDGGQFVGYAAVFDQDADLEVITESVQRGAFRKVLSGSPNVPMLWDHSFNWPPFAMTRSGSLKLSEDTKGLRVEAAILDTHPLAESLRSMVKRGDVDGMSWGFIVGRGNSKFEQRGAKPHRTLTGFAELLDVSPTPYKTYATTEAAFRSMRMLEEMATDLAPEEQAPEGEPEQLEGGLPVPQAGEGTDEEHRSDSIDEPSGAAHAKRAAARRRRLHMMGLEIPPEYRG